MSSPGIATKEKVQEEPKSPLAAFAAKLADEFNVRLDETGILRLKDGILTFVHPVELSGVMSIPINCNRSVAGRTAGTRQSEMHNNFVNVPHLDIFETLRPQNVDKNLPRTIQKLISAAVVHQDTVVGVLQVCRKSDNPFSAGPDFVARDVYRLEMLARTAGNLLV